MNIYNLIHYQKTGESFSINATPFLSLKKAREVMRKEWEKTAKSWGCSTDENSKGECAYRYKSAVIRLGKREGTWTIEISDLDVHAAVRVKGGLVTDVIANADLSVDVCDLDVSEFPDNGEEDKADEREDEFEKLRNAPGWVEVY